LKLLISYLPEDWSFMSRISMQTHSVETVQYGNLLRVLFLDLNRKMLSEVPVTVGGETALQFCDLRPRQRQQVNSQPAQGTHEDRGMK
jgi:hypothetical protein